MSCAEKQIGTASTLDRRRMKKISLKSQRKMQQDAARGRWYNLVELRRVPEFAAWLADEDHAWLGQSPDEGEILPPIEAVVDDFVAKLKEQAPSERGWCRIRDGIVLPLVMQGTVYVVKVVLTKTLGTQASTTAAA